MNKTDQGFIYKNDGLLVFFGNSEVDTEKLPKIFPDIKFSYLHQVHGIHIIDADQDEDRNADGQYTINKLTGLAIKTADCCPIMIASHRKVMALHAGWRGVYDGIFPLALEEHFKEVEPLSVWVGPHIQQNSFEVVPDLAQKFSEKFGSFHILEPCASRSKPHINLASILKQQLHDSVGSRPHTFWIAPLDTFANPDFHSYRRDSSAAGRNLSFVARL